MKIIISPAKQMKIQDDSFLPSTKPIFQEKANELIDHLKTMDIAQLTSIWNCSQSLAIKSMKQLEEFNHVPTTAAILAYQGIQYQYLAAHTLEQDKLDYLQDHLYIVSAVYGLLSPYDAICPYRLEMAQKIPFSLYEYWSQTLLDEVKNEVLLNLASDEYSKCFKKHTDMINFKFLSENGKEKGVYAKMARGQMVAHIAKKKATKISDLYDFDFMNFTYDQENSTDHLKIFRIKTSD